jgi:hypothetical protein
MNIGNIIFVSFLFKIHLFASISSFTLNHKVLLFD